MSLTRLSKCDDLDYKVKKKQSLHIAIDDGSGFETIHEEKIMSDMVIESLVTFCDGGWFEPWSGVGCYMGTKQSVDNFVKKIDA